MKELYTKIFQKQHRYIEKENYHLPTKPKLPLLFYIALGLWIGCFIGLSITFNSIIAGHRLFYLLITVSIITLNAFSFFYFTKRNYPEYLLPILFALTAFVLGLFLASNYYQSWLIKAQEVESYHIPPTSLQALEDARISEFGSSVVACNSENKKEIFKVFLPKEAADISYNEQFSIKGNLKALKETEKEFALQKGILATVKASTVEVEEQTNIQGFFVSLRKYLSEKIDASSNQFPEGKALLKALLLGNRQELNQQSFIHYAQTCGVSHMIAVSGSHLACIIGLSTLILSKTPLKQVYTIVINIIFIFIYLALTGSPTSALRAGVMTCTILSSFFAKKRASSLNALALCIVIFLCHSPNIALSLGFQLSAAACMGILIFGPLIQLWFTKLFPYVPSFIQQACAITLAASALTLPISIHSFSQISLISPFINILITPFFLILCNGGFIAFASYILMPNIGCIILEKLTGISNILYKLICLFGSFSQASMPFSPPYLPLIVIVISILIVLYIRWPNPSWKKLSIFVVIPLSFMLSITMLSSLFEGDKIVMLDIGQGDAFLLKSKGKSLLIDTGCQDRKLIEGLARQNIKNLDGIAISHPDKDHCASLEALEGIVSVDKVFLSAPSLSCSTKSMESLKTTSERISKTNINPLYVGDSIILGNFTIHMLAPSSFSYDGGNEDSMCLFIELDINGDKQSDWTAFFSGDAESQQIENLIDKNQLKHFDIYKVAHHGSKESISAKIAETCTPKLALISCGKDNRYGHPNKETTDILTTYGIPYIRSDEHSETICEFSNNSIQIKTLR